MIKKNLRLLKPIRHIDEIVTLFCLCCLLPSSLLYANDEIEKADVSLSTLIHFSDPSMWTDLDNKTQEDLSINLEQEWMKRGLPENKQSICINIECTPAAMSDYLLEITVAGVTKGKLTQGISISIEQSDPRKAHIHEQIVLPITCTLRYVENAKMINLNQWNAPLPARVKSGEQTDGHHLARLLVDACQGTVFNSGIQYAGMSPKNQTDYSTPFPEVTVEKRIIKSNSDTASPHSALLNKVNDDVTEADDKKKNQLKITRDNSENEHTQYVIKNPASEVIIEFGRQR